MIDMPPPAATEQTMHIGDLADATGLSQRTIRHYDEVGLLPATTRSDGGFRIYTGSDLQRMLVIRSMKPLGFTLEEMGELLDTVDVLTADPDNNDARELLAQYVHRANDKRDKLALNLKRANAFIQDLSSK